MTFNQTTANVVFALIATWTGLQLAGSIPDNKYTHTVSFVLSGLQIFLVHMGFNRTPNGTVLPDAVKKFTDNNVEATLRKVTFEDGVEGQG